MVGLLGEKAKEIVTMAMAKVRRRGLLENVITSNIINYLLLVQVLYDRLLLSFLMEKYRGPFLELAYFETPG